MKHVYESMEIVLYELDIGMQHVNNVLQHVDVSLI